MKKKGNVNLFNLLKNQPNLRMKFLKTILRSLDAKNRSENLNQKFKLLPINLKTEILNMRTKPI